MATGQRSGHALHRWAAAPARCGRSGAGVWPRPPPRGGTQSGRSRCSGTGPGRSVPVGDPGAVRREHSCDRVDRSAERGRGAGRRSRAGAGRARIVPRPAAGRPGGHAAARGAGGARSGRCPAVCRHRHDPHPVDLRTACRHSRLRRLPALATAADPPPLDASGGALDHRLLRASGRTADAGGAGHDRGLVGLSGGGHRPPRPRNDSPRGGAGGRAHLAAGRTVSSRGAALFSRYGRVDHGGQSPRPAGCRRRPDRPAHRAEPLALGAAAAAVWHRGRASLYRRLRGVGGDGPDRGGAVSRGEPRGGARQSAHRAPGGAGHGMGFSVSRHGLRVVHGCLRLRLDVRSHIGLPDGHRRSGGRPSGGLCLGRRAAGLVGDGLVCLPGGGRALDRAGSSSAAAHLGARGRLLGDDRDRGERTTGCGGFAAHRPAGCRGVDGAWLWRGGPQPRGTLPRLRCRSPRRTRGGAAGDGGRALGRGDRPHRHARDLPRRRRPFQCRARSDRAIFNRRDRGVGGLPPSRHGRRR